MQKIDDYALSRELYKTYGISEWHEKRMLLTAEEQIRILSDLIAHTSSDLLEIVSLPFPKFTEKYFQNYPASAAYFKDPSFAYKLYFLDDANMRIFAEQMRNPNLSRKAILRILGYKEGNFDKNLLNVMMMTSFEDIPKMISVANVSQMNLVKFVYLTQYIDAAEAARLKLSLATVFERDHVDGYELDKKLAILNPATRFLMTAYLGLEGYHRHQVSELKSYFSENRTYVPYIQKLIDTLLPRLARPYGEMYTFLKFAGQSSPSNMFEYGNKEFRDLDIVLETKYFAHNVLSQTEKEVLSSYPSKKQKLYLAAKCMYKDAESLARNFTSTVSQIEEQLSTIKI